MRCEEEQCQQQGKDLLRLSTRSSLGTRSAANGFAVRNTKLMRRCQISRDSIICIFSNGSIGLDQPLSLLLQQDLQLEVSLSSHFGCLISPTEARVAAPAWMRRQSHGIARYQVRYGVAVAKSSIVCLPLPLVQVLRRHGSSHKEGLYLHSHFFGRHLGFVWTSGQIPQPGSNVAQGPTVHFSTHLLT